MPSGFRSGGIDFDGLFDPYVTGTPPAATGFRSGGVDLAGRYAPLVYGTQRADVGFRISGGADVSTLWAAAGTARYVSSDCGLPGEILSFASGSGPLTAVASFSILRNGSTSWTPPGLTGAWYFSPPPNIGDLYEVRITQTAGGPTGSPANLSTGWLTISQTRTTSLSISRSTSGSSQASRTVLVEIRKVGDVAISASRSIDLSVEVDIE